MSVKNCNFCIAPFANLLISPDGNTFMCPKNTTLLGNTNVDNIEDIWNSQRLNQIREKFRNNEKDASCSNCWQVEEDGGISLRQFSTELYFNNIVMENPEKILENWKNGILKIKRFEFALSNACNLSCRHCWPISSTGLSAPKFRPALEVLVWPKRKLENGDELLGAHESFSEATFESSMKYVSESADQISIVGGEPFLDRRIMSFLSTFSLVDRERIHLTITSNFSMPEMIKKSIPYLEKFKKIDIVVSIDGSEPVTEYIRNGSSVIKIKDSVEIIKQHFIDKPQSSLLLCNFAFQAMNLLDLTNAIRFIAGELKIQTISLLHVHEKHLNINILPFEIKQIAKSRLMDFIINEFEGLIDSIYHELYYSTIFKPVLNMCDSPDRNAQGWNEFMEYTEKMDVATSKSIFEVVPEFKNYWFKLDLK